jgi:hypothetical protein
MLMMPGASVDGEFNNTTTKAERCRVGALAGLGGLYNSYKGGR